MVVGTAVDATNSYLVDGQPSSEKRGQATVQQRSTAEAINEEEKMDGRREYVSSSAVHSIWRGGVGVRFHSL